MLSVRYLLWLACGSAAFNIDLNTLSTRTYATSEDQLPAGVLPAIAFEKSTWIAGSVYDDPFYQVSPQWANADFGTVLRVEDMDPTLYTIPATTSISRILYQSKSLLGNKVPASGYVLFPYVPRKVAGGNVPVVIWGHGTSGLHANAGPSHLIDLFQNAQGPSALVNQGYVVVAPDYAGLGVPKNAAGQNITHEYLAAPAQANDMQYILQAARTAFPFLGKNFTTIGHSEGGGAVWSFAEKMHTNPIDGYLGGVAISPVTNLLKLPEGPIKTLLVEAELSAIAEVYPGFNISSILTPQGLQRFNLELATGGNVAVTIALFLTMAGFPIMNDNWEQNEYVQRYQNATSNGGRPIKGPFLVIQGEADFNIAVETTTAAVKATASVNPNESIDYAIYSNITHAPAPWVSQQRYLDWIRRRFNGKPTPPGLVSEHEDPFRAWDKDQPTQNFYAMRSTPDTEYYEVPA